MADLGLEGADPAGLVLQGMNQFVGHDRFLQGRLDPIGHHVGAVVGVVITAQLFGVEIRHQALQIRPGRHEPQGFQNERLFADLGLGVVLTELAQHQGLDLGLAHGARGHGPFPRNAGEPLELGQHPLHGCGVRRRRRPLAGRGR